jgi:hypothetical protein
MFGEIGSIVLGILASAPATHTAATACVVPVWQGARAVASVTEASRQECLRLARTVGPQPELSVGAIRRGPDSANAIPPDEPVYCTFIPYKMHLKGNGKSRKFWCHRTSAARSYYNDRHELVEEAVAVSESGFLLDRAGQLLRYEDGQSQAPDVIKVKYSNGDNRGREVQTEVAAGRLFWALGFPADRVYPARVWCHGCTKDPFNDIRTADQNRARAETSYFPRTSIERSFPGRAIQTEEAAGWGWKEAYAQAKPDPERRIELEAYVLAANLIGFHNGLDKQNTLVCESGRWDESSGACSASVAYLDDTGASFGGGSSRASYSFFQRNTVFKEPEACALRADLAGFGSVSEAARLLLARRLEQLSDSMVRTIFDVAGFTSENTGASVDQWAQALLSRIREIRAVSCL